METSQYFVNCVQWETDHSFYKSPPCINALLLVGKYKLPKTLTVVAESYENSLLF